MEKVNVIKKVLIYYAALTVLSITVVLAVTSCNNSSKPEDSKDVAMAENKVKDTTKNMGDNMGDKSEKDAKFLVEAAGINLEEIQLGQLAEQQGGTDEVKKLGKMMEDNHTQSQNDLKTLAGKKMIDIPTTITNDGMDAYKKLSRKSGHDFDKAFCDMMVDGHKGAISKFEKASADCDDVDIKSWASSTLPTLHAHLDHSIACQKDIDKM